jgi:hypothetical protein
MNTTNKSYCETLTNLLEKLSQPVKPRLMCAPYDMYTQPIVEELRISNYIKVLKEINNKCNNKIFK